MNEDFQLKKSIQEAWQSAKEKESEQQQKEPSNNMFSNNSAETSKGSTLGVIQGFVIIGLIAVVIVLLTWNLVKSPPKYAYKVLNVQAQFNNKTTSGETGLTPRNTAALDTTGVNLKDEELTILGNEGWELVGSFLEMETTHPNYGSTEYVTGLQPNIRPQRVVMIFRKQL